MRAYAHQLGLTLIDYGLPRQQRRNPQLNIITQDSAEAYRTPSYQARSLHRETARTNTAIRLTSVGGFDQPPSPPESPPDSPRSSNSGSSSDSEGIPMAGNIPVGGGGNPPPNPQLPWLRITTVVVPGVQYPLPKHSDKLLPKFNPDNKELAEVHVNKFMSTVQTMKRSS